MSSVTPEAQALADALVQCAGAASRVIETGTSIPALEHSKWRELAGKRAAMVDDVIDDIRHCLRGASLEWACFDEWASLVCSDVLDDPTGDQLCDLRSILNTCLPQAEALARARLDARTHPDTHTDVLRRLEHLCRALREDLVNWYLSFARLSPLARLLPTTWRGLKRAPAWAVVCALGEDAASNAVYRRDVEKLAQNLGQWATPHVVEAAQITRIILARDPDPTRIESLLTAWPWPNAMPPLSVIAACADTSRTTLTHDEWAAALTLERDDDTPAWVDAKNLIEPIEHLAPVLRTQIEDGIEHRALSYLADWLLEHRQRPPSDADCKAALKHMRTLWAASPLLAPQSPHDHALRIEPMEPGKPGAPDEFRSLVRRIPPSLHAAMRIPRAPVWRVPYTSPERAIVGNSGMSNLAAEVANHASFTIGTRHHADFVMMGSTPRRANCGTVSRRIEAVGKMLDHIAAYWCP